MENKKLLIATRNKGKFPEIVAALAGLPVELLSLDDIASLDGYNVEEPALTFEGNAIAKAMTLAYKTGFMTLADDSGLEVDALGGWPGVFSNREVGNTSDKWITALLPRLANTPDGQRGAQARCVIALYDPVREKLRTGEAIYRGVITREPQGENGFGFDPIFYNEILGKTNAQMALEEKNGVSHRGQALRKARSILEKEFLS